MRSSNDLNPGLNLKIISLLFPGMHPPFFLFINVDFFFPAMNNDLLKWKFHLRHSKLQCQIMRLCVFVCTCGHIKCMEQTLLTATLCHAQKFQLYCTTSCVIFSAIKPG